MCPARFWFLTSSQNSKILVAHYSAKNAESQQAVILIPPFGEELNRSKRMYVLCARLLANSGIDTYLFDYSGTGDSEGDWCNFGFGDWVTNTFDVYQYVQQSGLNKISLLTLRLGALTVAELIASHDIAINKCIFWDPVDNGEMFMRQLIRVKIAAAMAESSEKINTKQVLAEIEENGFTEIGGYAISQSLLDAINSLKLKNSIQSLLKQTDLHWMVLGKSSNSNSIDPMPNCLTEDLSKQIKFYSLSDVRFWMQQEVTIAPTLLRETQRVFL